MAEGNGSTPAKAPSPKTPIAMKDGRTLEFSERQKCLTERLESGGIRFDFRSGDSLVVAPADVQALAERFMWHGVEQKFRDEFASAKEADDAFEWVSDLHARIKQGEWSEKRESTGGVSGAGLLVRALMEITGKTRDEIKTFLVDKTRKEQEIMRDYGPVAEKIREIKAKSAGADSAAKAASLFAGLTGG